MLLVCRNTFVAFLTFRYRPFSGVRWFIIWFISSSSSSSLSTLPPPPLFLLLLIFLMKKKKKRSRRKKRQRTPGERGELPINEPLRIALVPKGQKRDKNISVNEEHCALKSSLYSYFASDRIYWSWYQIYLLDYLPDGWSIDRLALGCNVCEFIWLERKY